MIFGSFFSSLRATNVDASAFKRTEPAASTADIGNRLIYPPVDPGIPIRSVDDILHAHNDLIRRIKLSYGADHDTFSVELMTLIRRYARYVNLLPATPDNYFSGPGGLLRMGLEIAFYSLQATDSQIFSGRSTITNRRQLEPRWRHATFIAGLCSEIHRTLSHVLVTDDKGNEWPCYLSPLTDWLHDRQADRFFLRWSPNAQEIRSLGVFALPQIIPSDTLHHLAKGNAVVVPHMMASISGMPVYREHNIVDQLVRQAAALVIDRDLQAGAARYGRPRLGAHLERYLVDALRRLMLSNNGWTPNADKSRVWYGLDGLYIVWPNAVLEVTRLLDADQFPGIPKSPETILEILIDAGVVAMRDDTQVTWLIFLPDAKTPIEAIKLISPTVLFAALAVPPDPLPYALATPRPAPAHTAPAARASKKMPPSNKQLPLPGTTAEEEHRASSPDVICAEEASAVQQMESAHTAWQAPAAVNAPLTAFSLTAPIRLNPALRSALDAVIDTMNGDMAALACCSVPSGLFIPLSELERRHVDTSIAIRALSDLSMLVLYPPEKRKTVMHDFGGETTLGIVIAPQFITGFDPAYFQLSSTEGSDARSSI